MRGGGTAGGGWSRLDRTAALLLLLAVSAALTTAVQLGAAAGGDGQELLARLRERTERRVAAEREQLRAVLPDGAGAAEVTAALARCPENSQLRLAAAAARRERGEIPAALHEYRRAFELVRDYADRRSPHSIAATLAPWLRQVRPLLTGPALRDLYYLERALAGGCA